MSATQSTTIARKNSRWNAINLRTIALALLLLGQGSLRGAETQLSETDRIIDSLSAAIDTWISRAKFYARFQQYETEAISLDQAIKGQYSKPVVMRLRGEYALGDGCVRQRVEPVGDAESLKRSGIVLHDIARNMRRELILRFDTVGKPTASFNKKDRMFPQLGDVPLPDPIWSAAVQLPLPPGVNVHRFDANILRFYRKSAATRETSLEWHVEASSPGESRVLLIVSDLHKDNPRRIARRFHFRTGNVLPVVTRVDDFDARGWLPSQEVPVSKLWSVMLYENFTRVGDVDIAAQTRLIIPGSDSVIVRVWQADELRTARNEDFAVRIPGNLEVGCLRLSALPPLIRGERRVNILDLSEDDIACGPVGVVQADSTRSFELRRWWLWVAVGTSVVLVLVSGSVYSWARRKRRSGA
jgi:hypothetical protein